VRIPLKGLIKNVSTDCVVFGFENSTLEVLLFHRAKQPCKGMWALPGGFLLKGELIEQAARRFLKATTGINKIYLEEVGVFDQIDRFPPWRVFTIGHFALVSPGNYKLTPNAVDSSEAKWFDIHDLPELPWDHQNILNVALKKLRTSVRLRPIGFELLPKKFTLPQLQALYEAVLGHSLDKRNFRKKIMKMNLLTKLNEKDPNNVKRRANLYEFDKENYNRLREGGFTFEL
jgi:ADP-ribose pyrophosphatase YjhB (NUDIX family)